MSEEPGLGVAVRAVWPAFAGQDALPVNQMLCQLGLPSGDNQQNPDGSFYLIFGHAAPPVVLTEADAERLNEAGQISVSVRAELIMTRARMEELRDLIDRMLAVEDGLRQRGNL